MSKNIEADKSYIYFEIIRGMSQINREIKDAYELGISISLNQVEN